MKKMKFILASIFASLSILIPSAYAQDRESRPPKMILRNFSYADVQVTGGPLAAQARGARNFYLALNEDSLLRGFRQRAGLPAPGKDMGGWYDPESMAGGHSFGQYISALARFYANTGDSRFKEKVARLVHGFHETIAEDGFFYSSQKAATDWPCYIYDKNAAGMRDAFTLTGNQEALIVLKKMTDWAEVHLPRRSDEWYTLSQGLYLNYLITKEPRYLRMAKEYDYSESFFDIFAAGKNAFAPEQHAYSHVNSLLSAAQAYESTGIVKYFNGIRNAWRFLTSTQMYATGGWGADEHFVEAGKGKLADSLVTSQNHFETPCGSYANVNLSRNLLNLTGEAKYGDNMERVLVNGMLAALPMQREGWTFYYSHYFSGAKKDYFTADVWPCCSGTYAQITADYPLDIYFHDDKGLYVNLFADSSVRWKNITLKQQTEYPLSDKTTFQVRALKPKYFSISIRIPNWLRKNALVSINGKKWRLHTQAGTFLALKRKWHDGDKIEIVFPRSLRFEPIDAETPERAALMYRPLVLVTMSDGDLELKGDIARPEDWIKPTEGAHNEFRSRDGISFRPLYLIKDESYTTYPGIRSASDSTSG